MPFPRPIHRSIATNAAGNVVVSFTAQGADANAVTDFDAAVRNGDLDAALAAEGLAGFSAANVTGQVVAASVATGGAGTGVGTAAGAAVDPGTTGAAAGAGQAGSGMSMLMVGSFVAVGILLLAVVAVGALLIRKQRSRVNPNVLAKAHQVLPSPGSHAPRRTSSQAW